MSPSVKWPDEIDEILDGDHVVALAYATPARGAVVLPLTNFGIRDRMAGTVSVNSSVGVPQKLERMRRNPKVALAFHTRTHGTCASSSYVLMQGIAELGPPIADYPSTVIDRWERFEPWRELNPLWKRWQRIYALRVEIRVRAVRLVVWPELDCSGGPQVHGAPLPGLPVSQAPPKLGTGPRLNHVRAARRAARLPHALLGFVGGDGFPVVVAAAVDGTNDRGVLLAAADGVVPPGQRRAALTAHSFTRGVTGQHQRKHTGWLTAGAGGHHLYAPHTTSAYRLPASRTLYRLVTGFATRRGLRRAGR